MWSIRAEIHSYVIRSVSLVKMGTSAAQKRLFFNLHRQKSKLHAGTDENMSGEQLKKIAHILDVTESDVLNMNQRLSSTDRSLGVLISQDGLATWEDLLIDAADTA